MFETPWRRSATPSIVLLVLFAGLLTLAGCSRIQIVYRSADFLLADYVEDYLDLDSRQLKAWEPRLEGALAEHRAQELPQLAGFFDQTLEASREGFDARNTACLATAFKGLYRDHARLAVGLVSPLLAGLDPQQVESLSRRFQIQYEDDRIKPGADPAHERRKRANRYRKAIEEWTGPLSPAQRDLVTGIAGRMPNTADSVLVYRTKKRAELMGLLRAGAGEARIHAFQTDWLVEYRDLPPDLEAAGQEIEVRVTELLTRLGASLNTAQRERLQSRLGTLRDDLLKLQKKPHMAPLQC
jgi:hypothetical protein